MALSDEELVAIVEREFTNALGVEGGDISRDRAKAWDYYLSRKFGNEIEGQSQVVTSDVSDVLDGMMPSILRIFSIEDNLATFDPVGEEDVEQADQESDYVNHVFFKKNPAFVLLYTWFFDALLQKNGIVKAWWDDSEKITRESYHGLTEEELAELMDDEELTPIEQDTEEKTLEVPMPNLSGEISVQETVVTLYNVTFERKTKGGCVRVMNVPPDEYRISDDANSIDPCGARMVGQERLVTRSELLEMGFTKDKVDSLPAVTTEYNDSPEQRARRQRDDHQGHPTNDPSQDRILFKEAFIKVDADEDGRSELRLLQVAGNEMLFNEEVDRQPFHVLSPQPLPHKHFGRASSEKVMDIQLIQSTLVRQIMDNLYHTNRPSHAIWEAAMTENTLSDFMVQRVGGIRRLGRPVNEAWAPITIPFTAGSTFPMLEFWDKAKRDRTGVQADSEGLDPEQLKNIQSHVLAQASELSRMKIEAVVRIFAETGIKSLFLHIHEMVLKYQQKAERIRLRGKWVDVDPRSWRTREDMTVNIGLGIGTKEQNMLHLTDLWAKQMEAVTNGVQIVTPMNLFHTGQEIVKNANFKMPGMFFTDPSTMPPDQGNQKEQELLELQVQLRMRDQQLAQREQEIDHERNVMQHKMEMLKLEQKRESDERGHALEFEKIANTLTTEMEKIRNQLTEFELKYNQDVPGSKV